MITRWIHIRRNYPSVRRHRWLVLFTLLLGVNTVQTAHAQESRHALVVGVVTDAESGTPLSDVHVFVSKSTIGTTTNSDGQFRLPLPLGAHRLVVSIIGYRSQIHDAIIPESRVYQFNIPMEFEVVELDEITVSAVRDDHWDDLLVRFKESFLGETPNASSVEILNPEVLDFYEKDGEFVAHATQPLRLRNHALGYDIEHHLHQFLQKGDYTWQDGDSYFTPISPPSQDDSLTWVENRELAYRGSAHHFFVSLMERKTKDEGFITYAVQDPTPADESDPSEFNLAAPFKKPEFAVNPAIYLASGKSGSEYMFDFNNYLEIVYTRERELDAYGKWQRIYHSGESRPYQYSWIKLREGPVTVDPSGNVLNPFGVEYYGYMAFERLADALPKEYRPIEF